MEFQRIIIRSTPNLMRLSGLKICWEIPSDYSWKIMVKIECLDPVCFRRIENADIWRFQPYTEDVRL